MIHGGAGFELRCFFACFALRCCDRSLSHKAGYERSEFEIFWCGWQKHAVRVWEVAMRAAKGAEGPEGAGRGRMSAPRNGDGRGLTCWL